jgi:hypothetical protein
VELARHEITPVGIGFDYRGSRDLADGAGAHHIIGLWFRAAIAIPRSGWRRKYSGRSWDLLDALGERF